MDQGERIMPVPHGVISTSTGPAESTEVPVEVTELVEEVLPEAEADDLQ
jgi:hypothetical protein